MRMSIIATATSAAFALASTAAGAATLIPLVTDGGTPSATLVAQGCGLGYARGAYGRCRPSVFGFGAPGGPRYGYRARPYGYAYRPYAYGYRPYRYGY